MQNTWPIENPPSTEAIDNIETIESKLNGYLTEVFALERQREVVVLLSGGVDSSVALACLKRFGCENIRACYLKIWFQDDAQFLGDCPWEEDLDWATAVCEYLDVPLQVVPMQQEYYQYVVEYTLEELRSGRTPSPDIFCNQFVKFGAFRDDYLKQKYQAAGREQQVLIATGHYSLLQPLARLEVQTDGSSSAAAQEYPVQGQQEILLRQAPDPVKDQSYFLSRLSQEQLQNLLFPLGCLQKFEVRQVAEAWGLPTARRKDSQGICFLGKVKFRDFARHYLGEQPGPIVDIDAEQSPKHHPENRAGPQSPTAVLGTHRGLWFHTIGQRQGLGLAGGPWYVCGKDMQSNTLYVRHGELQQKLAGQLVQTFLVHQLSWLQSEAAWRQLQQRQPSASLALKLRHGPDKTACSFGPCPEQEGGGQGIWRVCMAQGDRGVAPGQFAVFYWGDICLGNATIMRSEFDGAAGQ